MNNKEQPKESPGATATTTTTTLKINNNKIRMIMPNIF
jgi:hypothetical protein